MPLVRIDLIQGESSDYRYAFGDAVYKAMVRNINVPENERFPVIAEHQAEASLFGNE